MNPKRSGSLQNKVILVMSVMILVLSMVGFGMKFYELVYSVRRGGDGAFAISPVVNYLLASLGFLFLLAWAIAHGMLRQVEQPKQTMLDAQLKFDEQLSLERLADSDKQPAPQAFFNQHPTTTS